MTLTIRIAALFAVTGLIVSAAGCGAGPGPDDPSGRGSGKTQVLDRRVQPPYVVSFDLRLRDASNRAVAEGVTRDNFVILENGRVLDYTETNQFVTPGPSLPLRVVLVLDYTNSMSVRGAIGPMIEAAKEFLQAVDEEGQPVFTATHRMGLVEFHDRDELGEGFGTVAPLTTVDEAGRAALLEAIPPEGSLEPGLTRVWDAVAEGFALLESQPRRPGEVYTVVFLTDGEDTSSTQDPVTLREEAVREGISLYVIDFSSTGRNESILSSLAGQTGGRYFPQTGRENLREVFAEITTDLRGQWNLTYITQKNDGPVDVEVAFGLEQDVVSTFSYSFNATDIRGDQHEGVLRVERGVYDVVANVTQFTLKASYIPRSITKFRFLLPTHPEAVFTLQGAGGLAEGWLVKQTQPGVIEIAGEQALEFGAFGNLGTIRVPGYVADNELSLQHDDAIYADLPRAKTMRIELEAQE